MIQTQPAAAANEIKSNIGHDISMLDAFDVEYIDTDEVEDVDLMSVEQRQALNASLAEWFNS